LEGYSRPAKNGRSAQDIRVFDDHLSHLIESHLETQ